MLLEEVGVTTQAVQRQQTTAAIIAGKVIAIVRAKETETAREAARILRDAGMPAIEVAMTTPRALDVVEDLAKQAAGSAVIGAGTVLDEASAREAIDAGAQFLVSPSFDRAVVTTAHRYGAATVPGVATPTEIVTALKAGADLLKVFPVTDITPAWVRAVRAALPQAPLVPTGGVTIDDATTWLDAGAVAVGIGGALTTGSTDAIQRAARDLLARVSDH